MKGVSEMYGYHFTADRLRNGEPIPAIGEWLEYDGDIVPCRSGLHASEHPFDALQYAPGNLLHRVELEGDLQSHGEPVDKWVGRCRRILATIDAEPLLQEFARWCALQVIHLWDAPAVVREYLETGDESKRAVAEEAAREATRTETSVAASVAALARTATLVAAWGAARTATLVAASAATWVTARESVLEAQRQHFEAMVTEAFSKRD